MKTFEDMFEFLTALNNLSWRYVKHEIDRDEYLSKFDKIVEAYEAIE